MRAKIPVRKNETFDIGAIVRESFKLAWKHKILWIFSMMLAMGSSSRFNSSGSSSDSSLDIPSDNGQIEEENFEFENMEELQKMLEEVEGETGFNVDGVRLLSMAVPGIAGQVLGTSARFADVEEPLDGFPSDPVELLFDQLENLDWDYVLSRIPIDITLVVLFLLVAIVVSTIIGFVIKAWTTTALLFGTSEGIKGEVLELKKLSSKGISLVKNVVQYLVYMILLALIPVLVFMILILVFLLIDSGVDFIGVLFFISSIGFVVMIVYFFNLNLIGKLAVRYVVLEGMTPKNSIRTGWEKIKSNFWKSVGLSVVNIIVRGVIMFGVFAVLGILALALILPFGLSGLFSEGGDIWQNLGPILTILGIIGIPLLIVVAVGLGVLGGFLYTYEEFTWTMFFNYVNSDHAKDGVAPSDSSIASSETPSTTVARSQQPSTPKPEPKDLPIGQIPVAKPQNVIKEEVSSLGGMPDAS